METNSAEKRKRILKGTIIGLSSTVFCFLAFYLFVSLTQNPDFIVRDLQEKYAKVSGTSSAMNLNVRFTGPPGKPIVTTAPECSSTNPYVDLNWNATSDTTDYDIQKNSLPLATGITDIFYQDNAVNNNTTYIYKVTANGPLGNTDSDEVSATTGDCSLNAPVTCKIQSMNDKQLASYDGTPKTKDRLPKFSGNSNTPSAIISIIITGETSVAATTAANSNGYWIWEPPIELNYGNHIISVIATDPSNSLRYGTDTLFFNVEKEDEKGENKEAKKEITPAIPIIPNIKIPLPQIIPPEETEEITVPFILNLTVANPEKKVFSEQNINLETRIIHYIDKPKSFVIQYEILDENGNVIGKLSQNVFSSRNEIVKKEFPVPPLTKTGKYKIIAKTFYDGFNISSSDNFFLVEKPIINLGGGFIFTLTQLMQNISWLISILFLLLLFFLFMLIIEHYLSQKALFHITEIFFEKKGMFKAEKGGADE